MLDNGPVAVGQDLAFTVDDDAGQLSLVVLHQASQEGAQVHAGTGHANHGAGLVAQGGVYPDPDFVQESVVVDVDPEIGAAGQGFEEPAVARVGRIQHHGGRDGLITGADEVTPAAGGGDEDGLIAEQPLIAAELTEGGGLGRGIGFVSQPADDGLVVR